jgi:hypothetical protein
MRKKRTALPEKTSEFYSRNHRLCYEVQQAARRGGSVRLDAAGGKAGARGRLPPLNSVKVLPVIPVSD